MEGQFTVVQITNFNNVPLCTFVKSARINNEIVIIGFKTKLKDRGLLFKTGTRIDKKLIKNLNLFKDNALNEDKNEHGILDSSGIVKPRLIQGVLTTGLFLPFSTLKECSGLTNIDGLDLNKKGYLFNKIQITYPIESDVPHKTEDEVSILNKQFKKDLKIKPFFSDFMGLSDGNPIVITEMLEGYSGRCGYLKTYKKKTFIEKIKELFFKKVYDYKFVFGNKYIMILGKKTTAYSVALTFINKLKKGETVYYTAVGYKSKQHIFSPSFDTDLLKHVLSHTTVAGIQNIFGKIINFSYGFKPNTYDIFIHRITNTSESGETLDLTWDQVKRRGSQLKVKTVPEITKSYIRTAYKDEQVFKDLYISKYRNVVKLDKILNKLTEKKSKLDDTSIVKGVVLRIESGKNYPILYKHINTTYNMIDSIKKKKRFFVNLKKNED